MSIRPLAFALLCSSLPLAAAHADEGMWTFDAFPSAKVGQLYGFAPDQAWLDHVRLSALRLTGGCSSSIVSSQGLVLTNHHCVRDCAQANSTDKIDYAAEGFLAATLADERKCPGQQAEQLTAITDVTPRLMQAIGSATGPALAKARDAEIATIEKASCTDLAKERCQVVTLFGGGQYKLYRYRKYSDVRLVYAPEADAAFFGGDPDNFNFPRYDLDAAFLRIYENGTPVGTRANHLTWAARAPKDGEVVFIAGNPGSTQRLYTQAQLAMLRDVTLPATELYFAELRGRIIAAAAGDAEKTRTSSDLLFGIENSYKAIYGQWQALLDPAFAGKLAAGEADLKAKVAASPAAGNIGDPWSQVAKAQATNRELFRPFVFLEARAGFGSDLYGYAKALVRAAKERTKPNADRLPGYTETALPLVEKNVLDPRPIYPWLEELTLGYWLSKTREALTTDDPRVKALLGKESPEQLAHRLVAGSKLADPAVRKALFDGGIAAVKASSDPLIQFVLANDPEARGLRDRFRFEVDAPTVAAQSKLAQARFAAYGPSLYPDATFTLRLSYGGVKGWTYQGVTIPSTTYFKGLLERATGADPYKLPPKEFAARDKLTLSKPVDFVSDNDIIGGNSGSPIMDRTGAVIGAVFDGNIHSLGGAFGFDPSSNRAVSVSTVAVEEALTKIYPAPRLLQELHGG